MTTSPIFVAGSVKVAPIESVTVTVVGKDANGATVTYEFHRVAFDPRKVLEQEHGVSVAVTQDDDPDYGLFPGRRVPSGRPAQLDLRIRGEMHPIETDENGRGITHTIKVREAPRPTTAAADPTL